MIPKVTGSKPMHNGGITKVVGAVKKFGRDMKKLMPYALLFPLYPALGICNLQKVICDNLASVISGIKGRDQELEAKFSAEIQAIKSLIVKFADNLSGQLQKEMGLDASDFNLDDHDISHVFEHWMEGADLNNLASPESKTKLIKLLREQIGISEDNGAYSQTIERLLDDQDFLARLAQMSKDLNEKAHKFAAENPQKNGKASGTDLAILQAASQEAGKARGGRN